MFARDDKRERERGRARKERGQFQCKLSTGEKEWKRGKTAPGMRQGDCALNAESLMILMKVAI